VSECAVGSLWSSAEPSLGTRSGEVTGEVVLSSGAVRFGGSTGERSIEREWRLYFGGGGGGGGGAGGRA